jgi:hypothetical protein
VTSQPIAEMTTQLASALRENASGFQARGDEGVYDRAVAGLLRELAVQAIAREVNAQLPQNSTTTDALVRLAHAFEKRALKAQTPGEACTCEHSNASHRFDGCDALSPSFGEVCDCQHVSGLVEMRDEEWPRAELDRAEEALKRQAQAAAPAPAR